VRGAESELLSPEAAREFIAHLEAGQLVEIPDAGHHVLIDQPTRLHGTLEAFLDRIEDRNRSSRIEEGA
jgi:pimeloyl-ACP methyl ester carboxylesterase